MKKLSDLTKNYLEKPSSPRMVSMIACLGGWKSLDNLTLSTDLECLICAGKEHYTPFIDPKIDERRVWICANGSCESNNRLNVSSGVVVAPNRKRAILWPLWCEINGVGDVNHDVKFESINGHSDSKIQFLANFCAKPSGIVLMQGEGGEGKTYLSLATCELFTRTNDSCMFTTQRQMFQDWLETFKKDNISGYINKVMRVNLLVVDDFGTSEVSPSFMGFFMDLINTRIQWKDRGTIISTNLKDEEFIKYCGTALTDRIKTGQSFTFPKGSRRTKTPI